MSAQIREDSRRYSSTFRIVFLRRGLASLLVASMSDRERVGMKESEFYPYLPLRPFRTEDAQHYEYQLFRSTALSDPLWGRNSGGLERQLLTPHPEIPSDFALADFRELLRLISQLVSVDLAQPRNAWLRPFMLPRSTVTVGTSTLHSMGGPSRNCPSGD
jgi:hypothetical protein